MFRTLRICLLALSCLATGACAAEPPNIVLFFIDDMGYGDIGPFGSKQNKTPNLDRMAAEGMKFTDFYVSNTACTPSRSALMTGCYADRVGMDGKVVFPGDKRGLHPDEVTIAEILKTKGYATGCFGKWHLGDAPQFLPRKQGFDRYVGIPFSNDMWPLNKKHPPLPFIEDDMVVAKVTTGRSQALLTEATTKAAVDFIEANKAKPFFAYIPYAAVHLPRYVRKELADRAGGNTTRAQVEEIDTAVGQVLDLLKQHGIDKKTLVVFTSDNGGARGTSMGPLRGGKGGPKYEGHMRSPTIAWWPDTVPAGTGCSEIAATIDVLPTVAELTDAQAPADRVIDGKSFVDLLLGKPGAKSAHPVHFYEYEGVRRGKWKYVKANAKGKSADQLYDLEADIGETKSVAAQNPEILAELKGLLRAHVQHLQKDRRKAAFVDKPKPLPVTGKPELADYLGLGDIPIVGKSKAQAAKKR
jgi:arylsulfatase A-like enzyme